MVGKPTVNYQLAYLHFEELHRSHPYWPLSDLKGMTPRQRRYWLAMGKQRTEKRRRETARIIERGDIPIG